MAIKPKVFAKLTEALATRQAVGRYEVSFAQNEEEVHAAQALRYRVLFKEGHGEVNPEMQRLQREVDEWDEVAFHVIVTDKKTSAVVGTMRLVSNHKLHEGQAFYTEKAFNISPLRNKYDRLLELSRACIEPGKRDGVILLLIWKFCMRFIITNEYQLMFGCASFHSTDYHKHSAILHYLYDNNLAPVEMMPKPVVDNFVRITDIPLDQDSSIAQGKRADIPTMLRGYLKIGARVSEDAIIDPVFNTTFLCIYVDAADMVASNHVLVTKDDE